MNFYRLQNNSRSRYSRQKTLSKLLKAVSSHPQSNEEEIDVRSLIVK